MTESERAKELCPRRSRVRVGKGWAGKDIGCQRRVRDPEREWGIQGTESWKEERKNKKKKKMKP